MSCLNVSLKKMCPHRIYQNVNKQIEHLRISDFSADSILVVEEHLLQ